MLITSDQVILHNGSLREKPETPEECREFLLSYNEGPAEAIVGLVVTNTVTGNAHHLIVLKYMFHLVVHAQCTLLWWLLPNARNFLQYCVHSICRFN